VNRGPLGRRYWTSLTGVGGRPIPERNWRGQSFWRRYVASFFVLPQPPSQAPIDTAEAPRAASLPQPHRFRAPGLFRYQSAVLAGAGVLVVVFSVTQLGSGSSPGTSGVSQPPPVGSGTSGPAVGGTPSTPSPTKPSSPSTTTPTKVVPWQGTVRVTRIGEEVTAGPPRVAGLRFGLAVSGPGTLVGSGNLAQWTDDKTGPTAATCVTLLKAQAEYQVTVQVGDQICIAALDGRTASAKVADEGTGSDGTPYVDLQVLAYVS
jgi:hypothetical protein